MLKKVPKTRLVDKFHRGFVYTCIGATIFGTINIAWIGYNYYMYQRPIRKAEALRRQQELFGEGAAHETA